MHGETKWVQRTQCRCKAVTRKYGLGQMHLCSAGVWKPHGWQVVQLRGGWERHCGTA